VRPRKSNERELRQKTHSKKTSGTSLKRLTPVYGRHAHIRAVHGQSTKGAMSQLRARAPSVLSSTKWMHPTQRRTQFTMEQIGERLLREEMCTADDIDGIVVLHAGPHHAAWRETMQRWRWKQQSEALPQLHSRQLYGGHVGGLWSNILQNMSRTRSVKQQSAALISAIFGAHRVLQFQRLACAKQRARRRALMLSSFVCMVSITSTRKSRGARPFGFKWLTQGRAARSENPSKAVELLRVAKQAAVAGETCALVGSPSEMDARRWWRVFGGPARCCRCCCWTTTTAAAASSCKAEERRKRETPVQVVRRTLLDPAHGGNTHKKSRRTCLSLVRPRRRRRGSRAAGLMAARRLTRARPAPLPLEVLENRVDGPVDGLRIVPGELRGALPTLELEGDRGAGGQPQRPTRGRARTSCGRRGDGRTAADGSATRLQSSAADDRGWKSVSICHSMHAQGVGGRAGQPGGARRRRRNGGPAERCSGPQKRPVSAHGSELRWSV